MYNEHEEFSELDKQILTTAKRIMKLSAESGYYRWGVISITTEKCFLCKTKQDVEQTCKELTRAGAKDILIAHADDDLSFIQLTLTEKENEERPSKYNR
jgi:ethanolamine utilization protein EutP (predicted NTPase)